MDGVEQLCNDYAHLPREAAAYMARRSPAWVHPDDLEPAAWHGLYQAAASYDPDRGTAFTAWAWHSMVNEIRDDMRGIDHVPGRRRRDRRRHRGHRRSCHRPEARSHPHDLIPLGGHCA